MDALSRCDVFRVDVVFLALLRPTDIVDESKVFITHSIDPVSILTQLVLSTSLLRNGLSFLANRRFRFVLAGGFLIAISFDASLLRFLIVMRSRARLSNNNNNYYYYF